jgi:signal transduction histidine kinase
MAGPETMGAATTGMAWAWLRRPTLSRRIAAAMVLSLFAIQVQALLQIMWLSNPELRLVGTRWFSEQAADMARSAFAVPAAEREVLLQRMAQDRKFTSIWSKSAPVVDNNTTFSIPAAQLSATLQDIMGENAKAVAVQASQLRFQFPMMNLRLVSAESEVNAPINRGPIRLGEPDILIPAGMRLWIEGHDGSWIGVEANGFRDTAFGVSLPFGPLLAGGIIIALVSTLMARRLMAPLDRLVLAAQRIGTAREPVQLQTGGLHEFSAVAHAFEDMQQRLLRFVEDRTRILAAISHDLRSSLTRLTLTAEQCQGASERAALSAEIAEMQSMVESTLSFASGEAQLAPTQPTDVAALLISLVDEATDAGKASSYKGPDHIETLGHPMSLKRAFRNVIDNALKFGRVSRVGLTVSSATVTVTVDDDGAGIPDASLEDVFAPFRRLDPARGHETPGVGLGLTIARDVIQSHGGTITLANRAGEGLTVTMVLPRR